MDPAERAVLDAFASYIAPSPQPNPQAQAPPNKQRPHPSNPSFEYPKRRGPKPKPLSERVYKAPKPRRQHRTTFSKKTKMEVLMWLTHHKVSAFKYDGYARPEIPIIRPPTHQEAANHFKIDRSTVSRWWRTKDQILHQKGGTRRNTKKKSTTQKVKDKNKGKETDQDKDGGKNGDKDDDKDDDQEDNMSEDGDNTTESP
ncbi:hypothetical protein M501DRAFT_1016390 [Patellaria atrata CBS 101060]|uniref:Uncharacterized protein n=1 Tax=Patellaria atrata CBS 101060 TaxID=1346257 RepID=A0A9P4SAW3_9PEZI|nr:hypothetical protein M501DRAFT_1016390 [Patellaria atrata CBS 101060]